MNWYIGCSGFYYKNWKGIFYPSGLPPNNWFEYYCGQFETLESNVTFYRFPQLEFLLNWYKACPGSFRFAVKAPKLITHYKQFRDCEKLLDEFYDTIAQGLNDKLGAVLFQLPPWLTYDAELLKLIIGKLRKDFKNTIEFRHSSWWTEEVFKSLENENIVFAGVSHPKLPDEVIVTNHTAYYRFHGVPQFYYSAYKQGMLRRVADTLANNKTVQEAYVYFNNTATIGAIENAVWLKEYTQKI